MTTRPEPSEHDFALYDRARADASDEHGGGRGYHDFLREKVARAIATARAEERERCLKVVQGVAAIVDAGTWRLACLQIAAKIRSGQ